MNKHEPEQGKAMKIRTTAIWEVEFGYGVRVVIAPNAITALEALGEDTSQLVSMKRLTKDDCIYDSEASEPSNPEGSVQ